MTSCKANKRAREKIVSLVKRKSRTQFGALYALRSKRTAGMRGLWLPDDPCFQEAKEHVFFAQLQHYNVQLQELVSAEYLHAARTVSQPRGQVNYQIIVSFVIT